MGGMGQRGGAAAAFRLQSLVGLEQFFKFAALILRRPGIGPGKATPGAEQVSDGTVARSKAISWSPEGGIYML